MCKCEIQWVDSAGQLTPDDNDAIGYAIPFSYSGTEGTKPAYPICAAHAARMPREGWMLLRGIDAAALSAQLVETATVAKAIRDAFTDSEQILPTLRAHPSDGYYSFIRWGMFVGVERDGYIHT